MRTNFLENANSHPRRRGPPLGRLWPRVTVCGPALPPQFLGLNSCAGQDVVVADTLLRSRLVCESEPRNGSSHLAYFCFYLADQATWLEPESDGIQRIDPYEMAVLDSEAPLRTVSTVGTRHLSVFVPRPLVLASLPWADEICARSLGLDLQTRSAIHSLIAAFRSSIGLEQFDVVAPGLVQALLALLSTIGSVVGPTKPRLVVTIRQEQVTECIKRRFSDPALTVAAIAEELRVSPRYLQRVCEDGASPGEQLRQFRLRAAAERLRDPVWKERSISEVCYACGFGSSSHFSTEFRRFYGVTPRDYRCG